MRPCLQRHLALAGALGAGAVVVSLVAACALVTDFDPSRLAETSEALCTDGADNDGDGLADCQAFSCLGLKPCCTLPRVFVADDFAGTACAATACSEAGPTEGCLDPAVWQAWGSPLPLVCEGGLSPRKGGQCYEVGVLARAAVPLKPGLRVAAGLEGRPALAGRLIIGLTRQGQVQGSSDECANIEPLLPLVSAETAPAAAGYSVVGTFDQQEIGRSPAVTDEARHQVDITVDDERRVRYALDGQEFAASPEDLPLPMDEREVRVALAGRDLAAHFTDVRVTAETRCEAPGAWGPAPVFQSLAHSTAGYAWDGFEVASPAVVPGPGAQTRLLYVGCRERAGACELEGHSVGWASAQGDEPFTRQSVAEPLVSGADLYFVGAVWRDVEVTVVTAGPDLHLYVLPDGVAGLYLFSWQEGATRASLLSTAGPVLPVGLAGTWDDARICCASAVRRDDGQVLLWYAGQSKGDERATWRIGLATSADGLSFTRHAANPVLGEGQLEEFDGRGVSEPEVVWDDRSQMYRMWYTAHAFLGDQSIAYAASSDGVKWQKYPQNPVVTQDLVGLEAIGSPAVLLEESQLRLWFHAREPGGQRRAIYEVRNAGAEYAPGP